MEVDQVRVTVVAEDGSGEIFKASVFFGREMIFVPPSEAPTMKAIAEALVRAESERARSQR
jgi:hypothetical protein